MEIYNKKDFIKIRQNVIFHFYRDHKELLNEFRIWFAARHIVDSQGVGWVTIQALSKATKLSREYLRRLCYSSELIRGMDSNRIYYQSISKVMDKH